MAGGGTSNLIVLFAPDTPLIRKRNHQELKLMFQKDLQWESRRLVQSQVTRQGWPRARWRRARQERCTGSPSPVNSWWDTVRDKRWCLESKGREIVPHHIHSRLEHSDIFGLNQPSTSPTFQGTHYVVTCLHFTRLVTDVKFSLSLLRTSLCSGYIWFYDVL